MKKKKSIVKTISLDPNVHEVIERLRRKMKRSFSAQVSFMLQERINENKTVADDILPEGDTGNEKDQTPQK